MEHYHFKNIHLIILKLNDLHNHFNLVICLNYWEVCFKIIRNQLYIYS